MINHIEIRGPQTCEKKFSYGINFFFLSYWKTITTYTLIFLQRKARKNRALDKHKETKKYTFREGG